MGKEKVKEIKASKINLIFFQLPFHGQQAVRAPLPEVLRPHRGEERRDLQRLCPPCQTVHEIASRKLKALEPRGRRKVSLCLHFEHDQTFIKLEIINKICDANLTFFDPDSTTTKITTPLPPYLRDISYE